MDPITQFENFLKEKGILTDELIQKTREKLSQHVISEFEIADAYPKIIPDLETELNDVYADFANEEIPPKKIEVDREIRFIDAITEALDESMQRYPDLVIMGQDIAEYGGAFKVTEGFYSKYGKDRVRNKIGRASCREREKSEMGGGEE